MKSHPPFSNPSSDPKTNATLEGEAFKRATGAIHYKERWKSLNEKIVNENNEYERKIKALDAKHTQKLNALKPYKDAKEKLGQEYKEVKEQLSNRLKEIALNP